ncbi:MAG: acyl-CoA dehydrogenase C-terminal domain-containing protein [Rhodospirillales bacterium]|nr:acyl-CoA dehydrogenase C-terminal domain-containing protein [Rhodospirillales bacterium]MDH3909823.1 acyl-CoA dehydrogenase C-terminal domain-containing protein [Rhodospirillales bacterium]MDH3918954.1 acyl-CoA dehydrogenase C-terminal domain-containing protein [Rhodospirillales bacterium]
MVTYSAPLEDIRFLLNELLDYDGTVAGLPGYEEASADIVEAVLEEGAKFCENELLPLNRSGDEEGCIFENGVVRTPTGFKEAYKAFAEGGWTGLACDPAYGGQGLPKILQFILEELICSTNLSFGMYPGLSHGAYNALALHGSDEQKTIYLPKLTDGTWAGTMCLTEPHSGTDLGLIRTKAEPNGNGAYKITGTKIFISAGEHDLTENIVHLVLAKLPGAPPGSRGISLFIVPKFQVKADGGLGPRNGVACGSIEHKMGIKASSTCVLNFDEAEGTLVGEPHKGMRYMFTMMNVARLAVGIQGLGLAETAYQSAAAYAKERLQGRALTGPKNPDKPADPIIVHPEVRRNLLTMRAYNEGARALALWCGMAVDVAEKHPEPEKRQEADDLVALLTPIIKAFFTDYGFEATNLGVQVYGGHGYIREHGMEQLVRDARIAQLYEGANGIQALDLVGRKMGQNMGRLLRRFFHPVQAFVEAQQGDAQMAEFVMPLFKVLGRLQQATLHLAQQGLKDPEEAGAAASDYLRLFALTALAFMWARMARVALDGLEGERAAFYRSKLATARFFMTRLLPQSSGHFAAIMAGKAAIMELEEAAF